MPARIQPRLESPSAEYATLTDDDGGAAPAAEEATIVIHMIAPEPQLGEVAVDADDIETTGPAAKRIPTVAAASVDDEAAIE